MAEEKSPEGLIELHPDLCDILESSVFFLDTHYPFGFESIEDEIGSQISYYVSPPRHFCHP